MICVQANLGEVDLFIYFRLEVEIFLGFVRELIVVFTWPGMTGC